MRTIRQQNSGLSAARNAGARAAQGEVVAYTDDDCVADEDWLSYLVSGLLQGGVDAVGGPNLPPPCDNWVARCVAVSPGGPSHVMFDDQRAEHVPGCNMAFWRSALLDLDGFDPQFRVAGDDVDICWRLLDSGRSIGYAPAAMVWHHRRSNVRAYLRQQKGYGRSEAMVQFKHPQRFGRYGIPLFRGVIYGDGAIGLPVLPPRIYHGRFGSAPFQVIYRQQIYSLRAWLTSFEWHVLCLGIAVLGVLVPWLLLLAAGLWGATLAVGVEAGRRAPLPRARPWWCRPLVASLHLLQPLVRGWHRYAFHVWHRRLPAADARVLERTRRKQAFPLTFDLYWESTDALGREDLLEALVDEARTLNWRGDFDGGWVPWDVELAGDPWHVTIRTATEELGWPHRFTRARSALFLTGIGRLAIAACAVWTVAAVATGTPWAIAAGAGLSASLFGILAVSRRRCARGVARLLARAARRARLRPYVPDVLVDSAVFEPAPTAAIGIVFSDRTEVENQPVCSEAVKTT